MSNLHHVSWNSQFTVISGGIICFSVWFCDNSLLLLKMRFHGHSRMTLELKPRMWKLSLPYVILICDNTYVIIIISCERQGLEALKALPWNQFVLFQEKVTYIHQSKFVVMLVCNLSKHVNCEKLPFLHSLDALIQIFANSLAVLNQETMGRTDHVHCFQTHLIESCLVFGSA